MPQRKSRKSVASSVASQDAESSRSVRVMQQLRNRKCIQREQLQPTDPPPPPPPDITVETWSPMRQSASNRREGEPQTRVFIDTALKEELWDARYISDDLNDLMFRSHISTELARDVLEGLLGAGMLTVHRVIGQKQHLVRSGTRDGATAIKNAYERALVHGCTRDGLEQVKSPTKPRHRDEVLWNWTWNDLPSAPLQEEALVNFLNKVVDTSLRLPCMKDRKLLYRFALPYNPHSPYPLSYEPDKTDLRPDFVVLPIEAFDATKPKKRGDFPIYKPKKEWNNFTMVRLTGECKNADGANGVHQVQRYMRGTRRAQPWLRFVTAIGVTREFVNFMRGDGSGIERVKMRLDRGRSCLEFVRMLMAVVLCEAEVFGKNSHIGLTTQATTVQVSVGKSQSTPSLPTDARQGQPPAVGNAVLPTTAQGTSYYNTRSSSRTSTTQLVSPADTRGPPSSRSSGMLTASTSSHATRSSEKRKRNDVDDANLMPPPPAKKEVSEEVKYVIQVPTTVLGIFDYDGLLFTGASIRGRGTVVFVVHRKDTPQVRVALKMSWQDVARKHRRDEVLEILSKNPHENVLLPSNVQVDEDSTLRTIRAFTQDEVYAGDMRIEDRVLEVHEMELRRPVRFFWSAQDFVKGLRGALTGHQYLVKINILHRDVSENNVVLACFPDHPRGCIIDFDMAIRYEVPEQAPPQPDLTRTFKPPTNNPAQQTSNEGPFKAERTGTIPYMSVNVLEGKTHTHYDDLESFLYVLLLFFIGYRGPLPLSEIKLAHTRGFTHAVGSGRARNIVDWPPEFAKWSESISSALYSKALLLSPRFSSSLVDKIGPLMHERWGSDLVSPIGDLLVSCLKLFQVAEPCVTHEQFINVLDKWLETYPIPPEGCNNCPFKDSEGRQYV